MPRRTKSPVPELLPIPDRIEAEIALQMAETARQDLRAATLLYRSELFPQAVYNEQQAVEKAVKSFGLMVRLIKVNQLKSIRHRTVFVLLARVEGLAAFMGRSLDFLSTAQDEDVRIVRDLGWGEVINRAKEIMPSSAALRRDRSAVEGLDSGVMWAATLNLSRDNEAVDSALQILESPGLETRGTNLSLKALEGLGRVLNVQQEPIDYYFGMMRSSPRAWALSLLTMWHETPTRYPPTSRLDYWRHGQYTKEKPLLKKFPWLTRHTEILCDNVLKSAKAAVGLAKSKSNHTASGS